MENRYLHLFETQSQYNTERTGNNYEEPWVSLVKETGEVKFNKTFNANGHEYVDLGLPSGTLWAPCNLGAINPEDYGDFYAWGEVEPKTTFSWDTYKFGTSDNITKYNEADGLTQLELIDDAAHIQLGGDWCIPTNDQFNELINSCTTQRGAFVNGIKGVNFTRNGKSLFIPYAGQRGLVNSDGTGSIAYVWTSSLSAYTVSARMLISNSESISVQYVTRYPGLSIRPVLVPV